MENEQPLTEEQREGQDMEDNTPVLEDKELNKRFAEHSKKYAPNVTRLREAGLNDDEILDELYVIKDKEISLGKILGEVKFEFSSKKGDIKKGIYKLFEYIMLKYPIITFTDTDEIYIYSNGVYESRGEKKIATELQSLINNSNTINIVNEVLGHIKRSTYKSRELIQEPKNKICYLNGVLNTDSRKIERHSPDNIFFNKIPVNYLSTADCPKIKKFLREVVPEDSILVLQEFAGYCLLKGYPIHKAIMIVGNGSNGKSTFIAILRTFLGVENCVSIPLQVLETNNFAVSSLYGRLCNMFADLPARALRETSYFKMLTGQDLIRAEKKFKDAFFFQNYAKQIFSCNQIPRSPDDSDAFFRRWIIINFPNQFIENADKKLLEKLTTPEEMSGFFNFALDGLNRLLENGDFSNSKSIQEVRDNYVRQSDSVGAFCMDCIRVSPDNWVVKKDLFTNYADYCRNLNYPITPENIFHKRLVDNIRVEDYQATILVEGKQVRARAWKGIKFNQIDLSSRSLNGKKPALPVQPAPKQENPAQVVQVVQVKRLIKLGEPKPDSWNEKDNKDSLLDGRIDAEIIDLSQEPIEYKSQQGTFRKVDRRLMPCKCCGEHHSKGWGLENVVDGSIWCDLCAGVIIK